MDEHFMNKPSFKTDRLLHGADYNPEQWHLEEDILKEDFTRMREAGVTSVSIGTVYVTSITEATASTRSGSGVPSRPDL
jgi:hypothetical protein